MSKPYNGHESWNAWNVALWIGNDEPLYRLAMECIQEARSIHRAANLFAERSGLTRTPDGARYSHHSVELALRGLAG
jgi:hypothetical protein